MTTSNMIENYDFLASTATQSWGAIDGNCHILPYPSINGGGYGGKLKTMAISMDGILATILWPSIASQL